MCHLVFRPLQICTFYHRKSVFTLTFNKKGNNLYVVRKESLNLDMCFSSSFAFLPSLKKEDSFQRRNWGPQIELRDAKGLYVKLLLEECDLDSETAVHLSTDVWKVIIPSQNNGFQYGVSVNVIFFADCCKGKQCAVVKFQCMVKAFFPLLRCLLGKGDL